jgi:hypothetical protein
MFLESLSYDFELLRSCETFREYHVSSSINKEFASLDALIQAVDTFSVCPGADYELAL